MGAALGCFSAAESVPPICDGAFGLQRAAKHALCWPLTQWWLRS
jgi:hypothetical protein